MPERVGDGRLPKCDITGVSKVITDLQMDEVMPDCGGRCTLKFWRGKGESLMTMTVWVWGMPGRYRMSE